MKDFFAETQAVETRMRQYFDAVYRADVGTLKTIFHEKASMYGYLGPDMLAGTPEPFYQDLLSQPSMTDSETDCRCVITDIAVTGNIAGATLLVDGFYGAATVEDRFLLLKENGVWHIACKTFTTVG